MGKQTGKHKGENKEVNTDTPEEKATQRMLHTSAHLH